jgi:phage-related baseplate assembly protein
MAKEDPFAGLPAISFCQVDIAALQQAAVQGFQANWFNMTGEQLTLTLADRRTNFIYSLVYYLVQERLLIDASAKQNLLPYSLGGFLDALGIFFATTRLDASPATVDIEFTLDQVYATDSMIPAGTSVQSPSSGMIFNTDSDLVISAGYPSGSTSATCTTTGPSANGLLDINAVINWTIVGFTVTAQNLVASIGGADIESDNAFRIRLLGATDSYSPAGPKGRYRYWTLAYSPAIVDVSVLGPEDGLAPGNVQVVVLLQNGQFPDGSFTTDVYNWLNVDTVRDLCANLTVTAPSGVAYSVSVRYWVDTLQSSNVVLIGEQVTTAVNNWVTENKTGIGGSINPATLTQAVMEAGASYCIVDQPPRIALNLAQVGVLTDDPVISYQGLESDLQPLPV